MEMKIKSGIGFDAHSFADNRRLILGGAVIPYSRGLDGHSDADALTHAIIDALIGPALGKDIGALFPDTDSSYKDADSIKLLEITVDLLRQNGWKIGNVDAVIIAQEPKMTPYISEMRGKLAAALGLPTDDVSVKATTTERLGFTGRKEGVAALATAAIYQQREGK